MAEKIIWNHLSTPTPFLDNDDMRCRVLLHDAADTTDAFSAVASLRLALRWTDHVSAAPETTPVAETAFQAPQSRTC